MKIGKAWCVKVKKRAAVIFGGISSEHEVSCRSVINVISGFREESYELTLIGITKEGAWLLVDGIESIQDGSWYQASSTAILSPDRSRPGLLILNDGSCEYRPIDVVVPVLHGKYGEDGTVQGLCELAGIPYVGSGVLASAVSMDKISTKIFVERLGIRQANFVADIAVDLSEMEATVQQVEEKLAYPVFVKPSNAGSSCGVSKAHDREELKQAIRLAKEFDTRVLIEETIVGHEVECAVLGGSEVEASKVGEVLAAAEFYDYEAKYHNEESQTVIDPAGIPEDVKEEVRADAIAIFKAVSGFGMSRVDFFVEKETNEVVFNELNMLPGCTDISMYPMLWEDMGVPMPDLVDRWVDTAFERAQGFVNVKE